MTGSRQKIVLSGFWAASRLTMLTSVPIAMTEPGAASATNLRISSVDPAASAASTTSMGHSGCTTTWTPG